MIVFLLRPAEFAKAKRQSIFGILAAGLFVFMTRVVNVQCQAGPSWRRFPHQPVSSADRVGSCSPDINVPGGVQPGTVECVLS